jgi:hypothetical protein
MQSRHVRVDRTQDLTQDTSEYNYTHSREYNYTHSKQRIIQRQTDTEPTHATNAEATDAN